MKINLQEDIAGTFLIVAADGRDRLIQSDWDYPGIASTFGWLPCWCGQTDGTIDCEHRTASEMISESREFLIESTEMTTDDPDYY